MVSTLVSDTSKIIKVLFFYSVAEAQIQSEQWDTPLKIEQIEIYTNED